MDVSISTPLWYMALGFIIFFSLIIGATYYLYWRTHLKGRKSPFSGKILARGEEIFYASAEKIHLFSSELSQPENAPIDLTKAVFCRETNRIFSSSINAFGEIDLTRNYLKKYYSSKLVSWFRLRESEKLKLASMHTSLEGFQVGKGLFPGPLFVDKKRSILVGWKRIPETEMEIIVIQKPKNGKKET